MPPRELALQLINRARVDAGVPPVQLGSNPAAQIHADAMAQHCFGGHWGLDGTTSVMRYTLAGGHQVNAENVSGYSSCTAHPFPTVRTALQRQTAGLLASPGHRRTMLAPNYRFVNIGVARDPGGLIHLVQQFEGDYVRYSKLPTVEDGVLTLAGEAVNGALIEKADDLGLRIYYSPQLQQLTRGQLARTSCLDAGLVIAHLRRPPDPGLRYTDYRYFRNYQRCPSPYDVPADMPAPQSPEEALALLQEARERSSQLDMSSFFADVLWVTASEWKAEANEFAVAADVGRLLEEYGPGVYDVHMAAMLDGEFQTVSVYSIFYRTEPPDVNGER